MEVRLPARKHSLCPGDARVGCTPTAAAPTVHSIAEEKTDSRGRMAVHFHTPVARVPTRQVPLKPFNEAVGRARDRRRARGRVAADVDDEAVALAPNLA
jgi:hypothetical protein